MKSLAEYFPEIKGKYLKHYDPEKLVAGKKLRDLTRFSLALWHFFGEGTDPFGTGTMVRPWTASEPEKRLRQQIEAAFEFAGKLQLEHYAFHDMDVIPPTDKVSLIEKHLDQIVPILKEKSAEKGVKLLWGTANLFRDPSYVHGAAMSPYPEVFARAAAQVKKMLDVTLELGGENFVIWPGREGYDTLLNTDMKLSLDLFGSFLGAVADYAKEIGFKGQLLIEPKPMEPMRFMYVSDVMSLYAILKRYGLEGKFKANIEANHATLANRPFQHELRLARVLGLLGSIDINQGDFFVGWDVDRFPTDLYDATMAAYEVLKNGGIAPGGFNFDAKVRRGSFEPIDLAYAYAAGMDTVAQGFLIAERIIKDEELDKFVEDRYAGYSQELGKKILSGKASLKELEKYALEHEGFKPKSGRQEYLEDLLNQYISGSK
ncbi:xylose isomerase [Tardisphaera miroshnichenkoae]